MIVLRKIIASFSLALISPGVVEADPAFWSWAEKPVMGWNSWDFYGTSVNEERIKAQADFMADNLLSQGWNLITVDIQWYEPNASGFNYDPNATLVMDEWGRLVPATNRFPSSAGGAGFKPLADYVHSKGLKFGIHMMRGIPRQAWQQDLPVKGTAHTAQDIADTNSTCSWNPDMYGVDMRKPGAQAYYDSIMELVASWDVDFVKIDDLSRPYHLKEIEAIRSAIDKTGRPIILSTSPGETPVGSGAHVMNHANQWRISDDFWDSWNALYDQFQRLHDWTPFRGLGHFPDADMLPLGKIQGGSPIATGRTTNFTASEQNTLMTMWAIARSPLIHGGDMTQMDANTLALLTNDEVIAVNQDSTHNRQLFRNDDLIAWVADVADSPDKYLALVNATGSSASIPVDLSAMGFTGTSQIRSLWDHSDLGSFTGTFSPFVNSHDAALYRISGPSVPTPWMTGIVPGDGQVQLYWESISAATSYIVKRATSEEGPYDAIAEDVEEPTYLDESSQNGTTYYYVVSALISGQETPDSGPLSATPAGKPKTVSWNYDSFGTITPGDAAGMVEVTNWNNSWPDNPLTDLIDESGVATTLDLSYSSYNTWRIQGSSPELDGDGTANKRLLNGYLNAGPAAWNPGITSSSITLSQIPHGYYDIIVYVSSDVAGREGQVTDGSSTFYFSSLGPDGISNSNASLVQTTSISTSDYPAASYAVFSGLVGESQTLTVQMRDNDEWGGIAGFQIVPKSDPIGTASLQFAMDAGSSTAMLSWSDGLGEIVLQESTDLVNWLPSDPQPETNAIVVPVGLAKCFYRLIRP